jgi:hypothetical protein
MVTLRIKMLNSDANDDHIEYYNGKQWVFDDKRQVLMKLILEEWQKLIEMLPDNIVDNKNYMEVSGVVYPENKPLMDYFTKQVCKVIANIGKFNVFNNHKNEVAKSCATTEEH